MSLEQLRRKRGLGLLGECTEGNLLMHREVCQDAPVYFDRRLLEAGDKRAVRQTMLTRRCVDADDPQRSGSGASSGVGRDTHTGPL